LSPNIIWIVLAVLLLQLRRQQAGLTFDSRSASFLGRGRVLGVVVMALKFLLLRCLPPLLLLLSCRAAAAALTTTTTKKEKKNNIILAVADDLGWAGEMSTTTLALRIDR
jgi:hypothetical protein